MVKLVKYVDRDELKTLWRVLERLQADVSGNNPVGWVWDRAERDALVVVMDAVWDSFSLPPSPQEDDPPAA